MPQPRKGPRFGGSPAHHNLIMSNLATELIRHGRVNTTLAKAKTVQPLAEKMITFAKRGDVHARRQVLKVIRDRDVVHKLFTDVGPAFAERNGGYTRVLKTGPRKGDAAPMALIELVEGVSVQGEGVLEEAPARRWSLRRRKGGTASTTAQRRQEARAAAVDRGEDLESADELEAADAVPVGSLETEETPDHADTSTMERSEVRQDDEERPQADPAEVEARLGAEDVEPEEAAAEDDSTAEAVTAEDDEDAEDDEQK
jgi:large subunit ribosomal protein L17